jgi:hypothetical protein
MIRLSIIRQTERLRMYVVGCRSNSIDMTIAPICSDSFRLSSMACLHEGLLRAEALRWRRPASVKEGRDRGVRGNFKYVWIDLCILLLSK